MRPDPVPVLGHLLADWLVRQPHDRPTAGDTRFRHSDAGKCARALALTAAGVKPTNPPSPSGLWQMNLGTYGHEIIQAAITEVFGDDATVEVDCLWPDGFDGSGHADVLLVIDGRKVMVEVKTMGAYGWDLAVGINRKARKRVDPQGPRSSALIQGALNALALDADDLVLVLLSMENVSDSLAAQLGLSEAQRFSAQFSFPREVWEPWALAERARVTNVLASLEAGHLEDRVWIGDDFQAVRLDAKANFPCGYCSHRDTCRALGPGLIPLTALEQAA